MNQPCFIRRLGAALAVRIASCVFLVAISPLAAQPELDGWSIDRFTWEEATRGATSILIHNPLGDVRLRGTDGDLVSLLGILQHPDDQAVPAVTVRRDGTVLRIETAVATAADAAPSPDDAPPARVDLSIFVPAGLPLAITVADGLIEAKGLDNDLETRSFRGPQRLITSGTASVFSERGDVMVHWTGADWRRPPKVETVTGTIELWMPRATRAEVTIETAGLIATDYTLEVEHRDDRATKRARATLGGGGIAVDVRSARGDVRLLRSPLRAPKP